MRLALPASVLATSVVLVSAWGCSSFSEAPPADGGASDATPGDAGNVPATCTSSGSHVAPSCAMTSCPVAGKAFDPTVVSSAVYAGGKIYAVLSGGGLASAAADGPALVPMAAVPSFLSPVVGLSADATTIYVSTANQTTRVAVSGGGTTIGATAATDVTRFAYGDTTWFELGATKVARVKKGPATDGSPTVLATKAAFVAADGDEGYVLDDAQQLHAFSAPADAIGKFQKGSAVGAFAVGGGMAFASRVESTTRGTISRLALSGKNQVAVDIVSLDGTVETLAVSDARLYWIVKNGTERTLLSSDLCGGDSKVLGTTVPHAATTLSFDSKYVYAAGGEDGVIVRAEK